MMKSLVVLNYQREIPPFMQTQIVYAATFFDKVIYITPKLRNDNRYTIARANVEVVEIPISTRIKAALYTLACSWLKRGFRQELVAGLKGGISVYPLWKHLLTAEFVSYNLSHTASLILDGLQTSDSSVTLFSAWFSSEALAAARLKKKHPAYHTFSFAHSFEIDMERGPISAYSHNLVKHLFIDHVAFISRTMREKYDRETGGVYHDLLKTKSGVTYLGCIKKFHGECSPTPPGEETFRICTCSTVIGLKRLDLVMKALKNWNRCPIEWTHIGGGPLEEVLRQDADRLMAANGRVHIHILGKRTNDQVQQYYVENKVDLFINVSEVEGLPVSIMEAIAYGIPIMATDVGGTNEIVPPQIGMLLPKELDPEILQRALADFYMLPYEQKVGMRNRAAELWRRNFNAENNAKTFYQFMTEHDTDNR